MCKADQAVAESLTVKVQLCGMLPSHSQIDVHRQLLLCSDIHTVSGVL